jgi:hypothetical protein
MTFEQIVMQKKAME